MEPLPLTDVVALALFRAQVLRAFLTLQHSDLLVRQYCAAFQTRAELKWLPECKPDRRQAIAAGIDGALSHVSWQAVKGRVTLVLPVRDTPEDFWTLTCEAVAKFDDRRLRSLSYDLCAANVDRNDHEALVKAIVHALKMYAIRTTRGEGLSPDPW